MILCGILFTSAAILWQLPTDGDRAGYLAWQYVPCDLLMFCLAIRARIAWAWIGQALMQLVVVIWSVTTTGASAHGLLTSYTQPFPLLAVSIFSVGLHRTARQIAAHRTAERVRAEREARAEAIGKALETELNILRDLATLALRQIAAQEEPDPRVVRALEAALRDRIRNPGLSVEPLVSTLREKREHGTDVLVLDDVGDDVVEPAQRLELVSWAATQIAAADGQRLTLRVAHDNESVLATLSSDGVLTSRLIV